MADEGQTEAPDRSSPRMTTKEKVDAVVSLLGTLFSWPLVTLVVLLLIRNELPGLTDRMVAGPFGLQFAALQEKVDSIAETVDRIDQQVRFEQSPHLTSDLEARLRQTLGGFIAYLEGIGVVLPSTGAGVLVAPTYRGYDLSQNAFYLPDEHLMVLGPSLAEDPDVALREYAHYALQRESDYSAWSPTARAIESGLADYFLCSFTGDPLVGEAAAPGLGLDLPYFRNLNNARTFAEEPVGSPVPAEPTFEPWSQRLPPPDDTEGQPRSPHDAGEIWGGAFWAMRSALGPERADRVLHEAWSQSSPQELDPTTFVQLVLTALAADGGPDVTDQARKIFAERGVELPNS